MRKRKNPASSIIGTAANRTMAIFQATICARIIPPMTEVAMEKNVPSITPDKPLIWPLSMLSLAINAWWECPGLENHAISCIWSGASALAT